MYRCKILGNFEMLGKNGKILARYEWGGIQFSAVEKLIVYIYIS
jgi:hypothetical protein